MADFSDSQPVSAQGGGQLAFSKMPGAVPNGAPPQWGQHQDVNVKPIVTSQFPSVSATNGTRGSLHHSHPGSLSSHSSRDSSPAPSRLGGPPVSGMWPVNTPNHTDPLGSTLGQNRFIQQPQLPQQLQQQQHQHQQPPQQLQQQQHQQPPQQLQQQHQHQQPPQQLQQQHQHQQPPQQLQQQHQHQQPQQFQGSTAMTQNMPIGSFPSSGAISQPPFAAQRMPPLGQMPLGQGQGGPRPVPLNTVMPPPSQAQGPFPSMPRPPVSVGAVPPPSYGQVPLPPMAATVNSPTSLVTSAQQVSPGNVLVGPPISQGQPRPLRPPAPGLMLSGPQPPGSGLPSQTISNQLLSNQPQVPVSQRPPFQPLQPSALSSRPVPAGQYPPMSINNVPPSLNSMPPTMNQPATSTSNFLPPNPTLSGPRLPPPINQNVVASNQHIPRPAPGQYMPGHPPQSFASSNDASHSLAKRYPQNPPYHVGPESLTQPMSNLSVTQQGFNRLWGQDHYDLLQSRNILPPERLQAPKINPVSDFSPDVNCSPDIFRCTLTKIPETDSLLKKSRLPLGVLIHPFRDLNNLAVIQCSTIVRCRTCRTYINPFVYFMDEKHWKCNLCFRVNELPNEFHFDPVTKTYGEPTRRPEIRSATIEFIAPSEYMLRPPQPAVYLFLLDVSRLAVESGYLQLVCETLLSELDHMPGDSRTAIGFITYDSSIHFYSLAEGLSAPQQMVVMDIDDVFLPCPENLLANLAERQELVRDLLNLLPTKFAESYDTGSALGAALQAAFKLMSPTGGRVSVFQCCLPNKGPGALKAREDPANRSGKDVPHLNPATDFYKTLALEFSGQQIAVDLFLLNQQYSDLATIGGVSKFSGGCIYHFPLFQSSNIQLSESLEHALRRYLTRKIGFEAVMRIRCSRGLAIHTFYGNFFVRSTDLLSLPNINPDAGFGMQVSIEENLCDMQAVCFQAALLYTSSKGERRIRVHTLCLPIASTMPDILHSADQQCIVGLLAKMAVDRSYQYSVSDARDAFVNVAIDALSAYKTTQSSSSGSGLLAPHSLRLLPLYILALLKNVAFRSGAVTRLDDRLFAMSQMKTLPLANVIQFIYPDLYPVHSLDQHEEVAVEDCFVHIPPRLHLSAEKIDSHGAYLLDAGDEIFILVCRAISPVFCENVLGVSSFNSIPEDMFELPELDCEDSRKMRNFISYLQSEKPYIAILHILREDSKSRYKFFERLIEDRTESSLSYYEFLQHIKAQVK